MKVRTVIEIAGAIVICLMVALYAWKWYHPATPSDLSSYTPAQPIKEVEKVRTVTIPGPTHIVTIEKPVVVEKLKLPDEIAKNPDKQVIATAIIPPHEANTNAVAILDTKTGEGSIQVKQEPRPFLAFVNEKEIGVRGGIGTSGYTGEVYTRYTVGRVGNIYVAGYASATGNERVQGEGKIMLDLSYRWK